MKLYCDIDVKLCNLPSDIRDAFANRKLIFGSHNPTNRFLCSNYILDFDYDTLTSIDPDTPYNNELIPAGEPPHSIIPYGDGFFMFQIQAKTDVFRYVDLTVAAETIVSDHDISTHTIRVYSREDFDLPGMVNVISSGFQNLVNDNIILVVSMEDGTSKILECDIDMNIVNVLATLDRCDVDIHDLVYKDDTILMTNFISFRLLNDAGEVVSNNWVDFKKQIDKGYHPHDNQMGLSLEGGQVFKVDLLTNTYEIVPTCACTTSHFSVDPTDDSIYVSMNNLTTLDILNYYYLGPAAIAKFTLRDNVLTHVADFWDDSYYRSPQPVLYHKDGIPHLFTLSHPNRLYFIDAETMTVDFTHDIFENYDVSLINTTNNDILQNRLSYNDVNISPDGKYACVFESDRLHFFDVQEKMIAYSMPFPKDPSASVVMFRRIIHTCLI